MSKKEENVLLFTIMQDDFSRGPYCYSEWRVYIDTKNGTPYYELWNFTDNTFRPGAITPGSKKIITYDKLLEFAKIHSNETYNKYYGINEDNWIEYVIDMNNLSKEKSQKEAIKVGTQKSGHK